MMYNINEFRTNLRKAFNEAEAGEPVEIVRYDKYFKLVPIDTGPNIKFTKKQAAELATIVDDSTDVQEYAGLSKTTYPKILAKPGVPKGKIVFFDEKKLKTPKDTIEKLTKIPGVIRASEAPISKSYSARKKK